MSIGFVSLVGAGPGDPELLTLKGLRRLRAADVVIYDALVNDALLQECRAEAELIYAGKRAGQHYRSQDEINALLIEKAQAGLQVVRLKGGDPFVLPAYAGIPVTHRAAASSFAVITGHEDPEREETRLRWQALARGIDTLVFLMGVGRLPTIAAQLIAYGRAADTPAAVIRQGTTPDQATVVGTLATIAADVEQAGLTAPATLVVGEVVRLREQLSWFDTIEQTKAVASNVPIYVVHDVVHDIV